MDDFIKRLNDLEPTPRNPYDELANKIVVAAVGIAIFLIFGLMVVMLP